MEISNWRNKMQYWRKKMCCVSARRLSIHKLIKSFRIILLKNCKKDFQFHIKTTGSKFFYTTYVNFTFLGSHHSRFHFLPHKVFFFELSIKFRIAGYKNFMTNKFCFWALVAFDSTLDSTFKVYFFELSIKFYIKSKLVNI
jgi:hypothetical protein